MSYEENLDEKTADFAVNDEKSGEFTGEKAENFKTAEDFAKQSGENCGFQAENDAVNGNNADGFAVQQKKIEELEQKLAEVNDQYLRKTADFENFRKRIVKEKQEAVEFANQSLLLDLITILDDFERAINSAVSSAKTGADFDAFRDGIVMIEKRLISQLENKWGLKRFDSAGMPFDPSRHEALFMEKSDGVNEPTVQEDFAKGYTLKDRVVRTAKVKVLMPET
jgi:molecular chaperone GrpE